MRPRIKLLIYGNFPYIGGDPVVLRQLSRTLLNKGFRVTLAGPMRRAAMPMLRSPGCRLFPVNTKRDERRFIRAVLADPPDVFMNSGLIRSSTVVRLALRLNRPLVWRVISHLSWWCSSRGRTNKKLALLVRHIGLVSSAIITVSGFTRRPFARHGFRQAMTIPEGCPVRDFRPSPKERAAFRREFGLNDSEFAVGVLGHFYEQKNHVLVLRALRQLKGRLFPFRCFFIGGAHDPCMRKSYRRARALVRRWGLSGSVVFTGLRQDRRRVLNGLDAVVFPFIGEGFGMSLVEAMACEKPVLAVRSGAFPEIVTHRANGLLVRPGAPEAFARAMVWLKTHPREARALAVAARKTVRSRFTEEIQGKRYARVLREIIASCPAPKSALSG